MRSLGLEGIGACQEFSVLSKLRTSLLDIQDKSQLKNSMNLK